MGDADTKATNVDESSTSPPSSSSSSSPEKDSKKLKLNGGEDNVCSNNNVSGNAQPAAVDEDVAMNVDGGGGGEGGTESKKSEETAKPDDVGSNVEEEKVSPPPESSLPKYQITVMYNKKPFQMDISPSMTVLDLKNLIKEQTGVDPHLQKVLLKGIAKDEATLGDLGVGQNTKKILVIGSSIQDVLKVKEVPTAGSAKEEKEDGGGGGANNWCSLPLHKKVIDKGLPDDAMPGILNEHDNLPPFPLHGMYTAKGKVRLTFKLESDELWIGTKERTEKVPIATISNVISQPITGYEHYHIIAIQLGPTEASRFFVYWVPAQYVEAIKDALTGA